MRHIVTGIGGWGFNISWESTEGDEDVARRVIVFLEDRRLLFGSRHMEDEGHCVASANEIRHFLTQEIVRAKPGKSLEGSLRDMREACRRFMDAAGPNGCNFRHMHGAHENLFGLSLGDLRTSIGWQVALVASEYDIPVEEDLYRILPAWAREDTN